MASFQEDLARWLMTNSPDRDPAKKWTALTHEEKERWRTHAGELYNWLARQTKSKPLPEGSIRVREYFRRKPTH